MTDSPHPRGLSHHREPVMEPTFTPHRIEPRESHRTTAPQLHIAEHLDPDHRRCRDRARPADQDKDQTTPLLHVDRPRSFRDDILVALHSRGAARRERCGPWPTRPGRCCGSSAAPPGAPGRPRASPRFSAPAQSQHVAALRTTQEELPIKNEGSKARASDQEQEQEQAIKSKSKSKRSRARARARANDQVREQEQGQTIKSYR